MDTRFIKHQSVDALKFGEIMLGDYDIAVANPPYIDTTSFSLYGNYEEEDSNTLFTFAFLPFYFLESFDLKSLFLILNETTWRRCEKIDILSLEIKHGKPPGE